MTDPIELTCYVHPSWAPRLRPAASKRDWMEATPERFAYRCLPLAIANAHGWEIGSPCGFRARWNGGEGADAVEIECDRGADPAHRPVSLFGAGTITFHVEGLFRTPPGWNLWVSGPPNAAKHGLAPLAGVIETDWSPYTFTMNWRFTRPGEWVRFEQDEPFCFFFPVERGVLDRTRPEIRPLSDAPELEDAFSRWSASRDAFQEHVRRTQPRAPADRWQKLYYRGVGPDGEPGPADHQSKLRPPAFERCPVQHAPPPAKPAAAPAILAAAKHNALLAQAPAPAVAPDVLAYTLRTMGFDTPLKPAGVASPSPGCRQSRHRRRGSSRPPRDATWRRSGARGATGSPPATPRWPPLRPRCRGCAIFRPRRSSTSFTPPAGRW